MEKQASLLSLLRQLLSSAVSFTRNNAQVELKVYHRIVNTPIRSFYDAPVSLETVLGAVVALDALDILAWLAKLLNEYFLVSILRDSSQPLVVIKSKMTSAITLGKVSTLNKSEDPPKKGTIIVYCRQF